MPPHILHQAEDKTPLITTEFELAFVAGVQMGGRGEVEFEREVRGEGWSAIVGIWEGSQILTILFSFYIPMIALSLHFALEFNLPPPPPLCTPATQAKF